MRVGVTMPPGTDLTRIPEVARRIEDAGFDMIGCGEHVFFHAPVPNAFVTLAAAAGATRRIRLVSALTLLPTYPAALAAKLAATLDGVSNGRFELGVGVGGEYPAELQACGLDPRDRGAYTDEALGVLHELFTGEAVHHEGRFVRIAGERLAPPPVQGAQLPIWVGGRRPASMRRAGRFASVWAPYLMEPVRVAKGLGQARAQAELADRDPDALRGGYFAWTCVGVDGERARRAGITTLSAIYNQDMGPVADRYLVLGSPEEAVERFLAYAEAGVEHLMIAPCCPSGDGDAMLDLMAERVLPALRGAGA